MSNRPLALRPRDGRLPLVGAVRGGDDGELKRQRMKLSDEQIQQVLEHFDEEVGYYACPVCDGESGSVDAQVYIAHEFKPLNGMPDGEGMALVAIVCDTCGHVSFFSAEALGVRGV